MALYRYTAVAESGDTIEGEMEAPDQSTVVKRLQAQGHLPIRAEPATAEAASPLASFLHRDVFARNRASRREVMMFSREISTLLHAGLSLERALEILVDLSSAGPLRQLVTRLLQGIRGGASLADSLAGERASFPEFYVSMVRAGEAGGALDGVFERLADFLEQSQRNRESVRSALIYPAILVFMAVASLFILLGVVIPKFKPLFEDSGTALPTMTRVVIAVGEGFQVYWWVPVVAVLGCLLVGRRLLANPSWRYRWDLALARSPIFGDLIVRAETARLARTLGTLLVNGVNLLPALALARGGVENAALARDIDTVERSLREGKSLAEPLGEAAVIPKLAIQLIRVGEETGNLEEMFFKIADIYDEEVRRAIDRLLALLVPALTIGLGLMIAGIIGSIMAAILSIYDIPV